MSLRDKLPGRFLLRRVIDGRAAGPYSNANAHDEEQLEVAVESALGRPHDGFDLDTGDVQCGGKVVLRVEYAGVLGVIEHPVERPTRSKPVVEKKPLPPAPHLKAFPKRRHEKRQAKHARRGRK